MLRPERQRNCSDAMDLRRIIPSDITASAIAHLSLLTLMLLFSDVHPFGAVTAEQIPVEIVTPQDIAEKQASCRSRLPSRTTPEPVPAPTPQPDFSAARQACGCERTSAVSATANCGAAAEAGCPGRSARGPAASRRSAATTTGRAGLQAARARSVDQISGAARAAAGTAASPAAAPARVDKGGDNFDAPATEAADIASSLVAEFRRHLKTC